jgi:hypothetical protein
MGIMGLRNELYEEVEKDIRENCKHTHVGRIPLYYFTRYATDRLWDKEYTLQYVKDNYDINISEELEYLGYDKEYFYTPFNIYTKFNKENPATREDDGTREYFQSIGRHRYVKFLKKHGLTEYDYALPLPYDVIHHIYPLEYSNDNSLENLIPVNEYTHSILHMNPLESIKKYCFQAVDYYYYLTKYQGVHMYVKYNLDFYKDMEGLGGDLIRAVTKYEMDMFYTDLVKESGILED